MENGMADKVDVAFLKFCFVDIDARTDTESLFQSYRSAMAALEAEYPKVTFVYLTAPIQQFPTGWKTWVKHLIGRTVDGEAENKARQAFNEKLRAAYGKGGRLFDLAEWEATSPDGTRYRMNIGGDSQPSLFPAYTEDNGHLNAAGQVHVSRQLLRFLAGLS